MYSETDATAGLLPGMCTVGQLKKYSEKRLALSVALIRMIFRSGLCMIRSFKTNSRKSLTKRRGNRDQAGYRGVHM